MDNNGKMWAISVLLMALSIGCTAPRPESLTVSDRDNEIYLDKGADAASDSPVFKIAIAASAGTFADFTDVRDTIDARLVEALSQFSHFQVSEFSRLAELEKVLSAAGEQNAINGWIDADSLDALVVAKVTSVTIGRREGLLIINGERQYSFDVSLGVDFRMYDKVQRQVVFTKNISLSKNGLAEANVRQQLNLLARECVEGFIKSVGSRFSRPARVLQTRGKGLVARISMGRDHGLVKGTEIEFYEIVDNSAIVANAKRDKNVVGKGSVLEADANSAWVEVYEHSAVRVKRGHYAAVVDDAGNRHGLNPLTRFLDRAGTIMK